MKQREPKTVDGVTFVWVPQYERLRPHWLSISGYPVRVYEKSKVTENWHVTIHPQSEHEPTAGNQIESSSPRDEDLTWRLASQWARLGRN